MPSLRIYLHEEFRWKFTLFDKEVSIGRDHGNHVVLPQPDISRQHAIIRRKGKGFTIADQSGRGLQINNKTVSHATLHHGDLISINAYQLVFELDKADQHAVKQMTDNVTLTIPLDDDKTNPLSPACSIVVVSGPDKGLSFPLQGEMIRVGRSPHNHFVLKDHSVSSLHLTMTPKKNGVEIQDVGSTNGTYVEGHKILHATVPMGSIIKIGKTSLILSHAQKI